MKRFLPVLLAASLIFTGCAQTVAHNVAEVEASEVTTEEMSEPVVTIVDGKDKVELPFSELRSYLYDSNKGRESFVMPEICIENGIPTLKEYVPGNLIDVKGVVNYANSHKGEDLTIDLSEYVHRPFAKEYIENLENSYREEIAPYADFKISYVCGDVIDISDFSDFVSVENNEVATNFEGDAFNERVLEVVSEKLAKYSTYTNGFKFNSTLHGEITVVNDPKAYCESTNGAKVNFKKEAEYVANALKNLESEEDREPVLSRKGIFEIGDTYVEVSRDDQHLWLYKDGQLVMDSNVVTGNKGTTDTPTGVYSIFYMSKGIDFDGGLSSVRWAKFTARGHGLHDATWRPASDFESAETYKGNGSHGCVNLPLEFAKELYEELEIGTIVVVY